jgi:DNA polymerase-3 subunit beta
LKLKCEHSILSKALNIAARAVPSRTTINVMNGILLSAKNNILKISSSDINISIETSIEADVEIEGDYLVQAKLFIEIVKKLPDGELSLSEKENGILELKCGRSNFSVTGINESPDDFPLIIENEKSEKIEIEKNILCSMISKTSFAVSKEINRGILIGVLLEIKETGMNMVALDGFRMAVARSEFSNNKEKKIIIEGKTISEIGKILVSGVNEENIVIDIDDNKAIFKIENTRISARIMSGDYVDYEKMIPENFEINITVNKQEMLESVERSSVLLSEGKNNFIKVIIEEDKMTVEAKSEVGSNSESIEIINEGSDLVIGFNASFVIEVLKTIEDEEIKLGLTNAVSPCLVRPVEGNSFEYLILPIRMAAG